ncbi:MAG: threonine aldolase family protein, partial [Nocardioides sp.]
QTTELGTAYSIEELRAICEHAHALGVRVHLDGARISNAAASLGMEFAAFTTDVGVDIVSFGGTKNGLMTAEAVVVLNPELDAGMKYVRKSAMQLGSKMRFMSAQLLALLDGDLWLRNATHANAMARRLARAVAEVPGVRIVHPVQANAVFAILPPEVTRRLQQQFRFYVWDESTGVVRWMTTFDTTTADVDGFAIAIATEMTRQTSAGAP